MNDVLTSANRLVESAPPCILDRAPSGWSGPARAYFSIGKYAWPDPDSLDGLPYRRIDCAVNPAAAGNAYDWVRLQRLVEECRALMLADAVEPRGRWLDALDRRLRTWFVDPERSMLPHMEHAAALPGVNDGMWVGLIEGACLISLVDDLEAMLDRRGEITASLRDTIVGTRAWMARFSDWYRTSEKGRQDAAATNNHGLWYHLQLHAWTRFADPHDVTLPAMRRHLAEMVCSQIGPDGDLPHELARDDALGYVVYTLVAFAAITEELDRDGVDLLTRRAPSGALVSDAFGYLARNWSTLPGVDHPTLRGRRAVLSRWAADHLPGEPAVQALSERWWPTATPEQRVRHALGLRDWR